VGLLQRLLRPLNPRPLPAGGAPAGLPEAVTVAVVHGVRVPVHVAVPADRATNHDIRVRVPVHVAVPADRATNHDGTNHDGTNHGGTVPGIDHVLSDTDPPVIQ
jgi:hypothetical protein